MIKEDQRRLKKIEEDRRKSKKIKEEKVRESQKKVRRKKIQARGKGAKHGVFPMVCGPGGSNRRLAKAAGTPLWREAHLQVKKLKIPHVRRTFGS